MVSLALPVVIGEVGWLAMQIVDIAMVGRLGPEAIGAVGVGSALFMVLGVFGMGLLLGLDPLTSQAFGARRLPECQRWLLHGLSLAVVIAIPLTAVARVGVVYLDVWGLDPGVLDRTRSYLVIVTWSMLPLLVYAACRRYLQAMGVVRPIMSVLVSANVINAVANWLLVFGNWGAPALGVDGAAWATCISRIYMGAGLVGAVWYHERSRLSGMWTGGLRIEPARMGKLLSLGWPAAVQTTLEFGVFAAVTALAARLEPSTLAAHQVVLNLAGLTFMVPLGISAAGGIRVGHAVGRGDPRGAQRAGWMALALGAVFMSAAAGTFIAIPRLILRVFTTDTGVIETGAILLLVAAIFQLFDGLQVVATGVLRGLGDTRTPMLINLAGHWAIGLPTGYVLCFSWGWGVVGLWIGLSIGLVLVGLVLVPVWHRRVRSLSQTVSGARGTRLSV